MDPITRRDLLKQATIFGGAMLLGSAAANAQNQSDAPSSQPGTGGSSNPNEAKGGNNIGSQGPVNPGIDAQNMDSVVPPTTDHGNVDPFKYPFDFAHKKVSAAGWARQVTVEDLKIARNLAGVNTYDAIVPRKDVVVPA